MIPLPYKFADSTDPGSQRSNNEDYILIDEHEGLFAVVDGVGGELAGEEASRIAAEEIAARFKDPGGDTEERIREAIANANNSIYRGAQQTPARQGMACVLTLAVIEGRTVTIGHVGDCRLYRIQNGSMNKITPDHSPVGEREDRGEISEAEAMSHPRRNEVYRDVGSEPHQPGDPDFIDILHTSLTRDAALLLSSDGLTDMLTREEILDVIKNYEGDAKWVVDELVRKANEAGGKDNISVIFIAGDGFARGNGHAPTRQMKHLSAAKRRTQEELPPRKRRTVQQRSVQLTDWRTGASEESYRYPAQLVRSDARTPYELQGSPKRWWDLSWSRPWIWALIGLVLVTLAYMLRDRWIAAFRLEPLTLEVGASLKYKTIRAAFDGAHEGDTILVTPGTYPENVLLKSGVTLLSASPGKAVITAPGTAVDCQNVSGARISGFRVLPDAAHSLQIGIRARDCEIKMENLDISGASDAGIVIQGDSKANLAGNSIHNNTKAGLRVESSTLPELRANRICDNGYGEDVVGPPALVDLANLGEPCPTSEQPSRPRSPNNRQPPLGGASDRRPEREHAHE